MTTQTALRPSSGARYVLQRSDPRTRDPDPRRRGAPESEGGEIVYSGCVHLPDADVPIDVRLDEGARARVHVGAVPEGGPSTADIERMAAALVKAVVKSATAGNRPLPRKIMRWRG